MKGQQIFSSFLPGVTAAVLTTQPAWADTVKVPGVRFFAYPSALTSTYDRTTSIALNINTQLAPAVGNSLSVPALPAVGVMAAGLKSVSGNSVGVILSGKTGVPVGKVTGKVQGVLMSFKPTSKQTQLINKIRSATSTQKQNHLTIAAQESKNTIVPNSTSRPASSVQQTMPPSSRQLAQGKKNPDAQLPKVSENPSRIIDAAKLMEQVELCIQKQGKSQVGRSASVLLRSSTCSQQTADNQVAQAGSSTPAPATPTQTTPTPTTPTQTTPTPTTPVPTTPTPAGSVQIPDYLNANPNPLQFPTKPEEVRVQGIQPITLAQALEIARRNNPELQRALVTVERSRAGVRQQQAALLPTASLSTDVTRSGPGFLEQETQQQTQQQTQGYSTTSFSGTAQIEYDIYTSGNRSANIREAEEQLRSDELEVEDQSEVIRQDVTTQYYDLQQANENVRISQSAVANAQASLRDAQALERAGVSTRFEVLQSQVNLANAQQDLTNAISQQRIDRRELARLLNLPQSINVSTADPVGIAGLWNIPLEETIILALQNRPDLQQQLAQRNIYEQQRRQALSQLGPQVSLVGSYGVDDAFDDNTSINDDYSIGLRANLTLYDGGAARAQADQARANIRIAESQFTTQRNQIRYDVEQAYSQLQSNLENVQTANTALEQARESLRLARLRFQAGVGTQTDVIEAENDLTEAEGNRVEAILNYNRALATLQRAITARSSR
ncbi:TolC family protein [Mastigocladopsis repens]|uniref:TolC family protein n=1 Tax=Mastigocladopsis repens TaxID=221287 RepID=UPI00031CA3AD|nr:TolC family protein [Mastigocladopsis repens]